MEQDKYRLVGFTSRENANKPPFNGKTRRVFIDGLDIIKARVYIHRIVDIEMETYTDTWTECINECKKRGGKAGVDNGLPWYEYNDKKYKIEKII